MRYWKYLALLTVLMVPLAYSQAQVRVGVGVGFGPVGVAVGPGYVAGPPVCAYGYYDYYPYACAPYGYYGPQYFVDGFFVGVGPWYHWGHPACSGIADTSDAAGIAMIGDAATSTLAAAGATAMKRTGAVTVTGAATPATTIAAATAAATSAAVPTLETASMEADTMEAANLTVGADSMVEAVASTVATDMAADAGNPLR